MKSLMKVHFNTNNIQAIRNVLDASSTKKILLSENKNSRVLVGNFWYIISPNSPKNSVRKYYIQNDYFTKELKNYADLAQLNINIPKILWKGKRLISNELLYYVDFENIRLYRKAYKNISEVDPRSIGKILSSIHEVSFDNWRSYIHGNLHQSNFFETKNWQLWIFDLCSMHYWDIEYDFAILYFNSEYNDNILNPILSSYSLRNHFNYKKMLMHTLLRIKENIKWNIYINEEQKNILRQDLMKIKYRLWKIDK